MPVYSSLSGSAFRARARQLLAHVNSAQFTSHVDGSPQILHYDRKNSDLVVWEWPCYPDGQPVAPGALEDFRCEYYHLLPCCLCPLLEGNDCYAECKIRLLDFVNPDKAERQQKPFSTAYVAECANKEPCGYLVIVERLYEQGNITQQKCSKRPKRHTPSLMDLVFKCDKEYATAKANEVFQRVPTVYIPLPQQEQPGFLFGCSNVTGSFGDLDKEEGCEGAFSDLANGGLDAQTFWGLFIQCASCRTVFPRNLYPYKHGCSMDLGISAGGSSSEDTDSEVDFGGHCGASPASIPSDAEDEYDGLDGETDNGLWQAAASL